MTTQYADKTVSLEKVVQEGRLLRDRLDTTEAALSDAEYQVDDLASYAYEVKTLVENAQFELENAKQDLHQFLEWLDHVRIHGDTE